MLVTTVSRKEFLDILQAPGDRKRYVLRSTEKLSAPDANSDDIQLIWGERDRRDIEGRVRVPRPTAPRIVVTNAGKRRDFLAWVWTYLPEFRPFTAYTRVLDTAELQPLLDPDGKPTLGALEEACLGLILGEAATYVETTHERKPNITPLACASTYSYAMARALAVSPRGTLHLDNRGVSERWIKARHLSGQRPLRLSPGSLTLPWRILLALYGIDQAYQLSTQDLPIALYGACLDLFEQSAVGHETWNLLAHEHPLLIEAWHEMQGPRETRVVFFERFVRSLADAQRTDPEFASFYCGFLASQIGPGTLDYLPLITPHLDQFPTAFVWYGLCSGLQHRSSVHGFSGGLGRRVLREILRSESVFDSPQCDIALAELEALTPNDTAGMEFRTGTQGVLTIEIMPLVTTAVRWPPRQTGTVDQPDLFPTDGLRFDMRDLYVELEDLRLKITKIQKRITGAAGESEPLNWRPSKGRRK